MRKYIESFRIFTGRQMGIESLAYMLIGTFCPLILAVAETCTRSVSDFMVGFTSATLPIFSGFMPICPCLLILNIFKSNAAEISGYKYLHSIPSSGMAFRNALVFVNAAAPILMLIMLAVHAAVCLWLNVTMMFSLFLFGTGLAIVGSVNLTGSIKNAWAIAAFEVMAVQFAIGVIAGISVEKCVISAPIAAAAIAIGFVLYAAGFAFTLTNSKKCGQLRKGRRHDGT